MIQRIFSASLSPNTETEDVITALRVLFSPRRWQYGTALASVRDWLRKRFGISRVYLFNSGRTALLGVLNAYGIGRGDEVIIQAFTCVAVPNSVLWAGAKPVYADTDRSYNIDVKDAGRKITSQTKAIIVQHTFGIPADMDGICALAKKHRLVVIEDLAHGLGGTTDGVALGALGDAAFFSFGRDKAVSSVWGGAAFIRNGKKEERRLNAFHAGLPMPQVHRILRDVFHPIAFAAILPLYRIGVGKLLLVIFQRLRLLSIPVYPEEKSGRKPDDFPALYPNALAVLLMVQLKKLDRYTSVRRSAALRYTKELAGAQLTASPEFAEGASYLRYPVLVPDPKELIAVGKRRGILLGNWYHNVIDPTGVQFDRIGYVSGSCPTAEQQSRHIVNLPTRITAEEIGKVLALFRTIKA